MVGTDLRLVVATVTGFPCNTLNDVLVHDSTTGTSPAAHQPTHSPTSLRTREKDSHRFFAVNKYNILILRLFSNAPKIKISRTIASRESVLYELTHITTRLDVMFR